MQAQGKRRGGAWATNENHHTRCAASVGPRAAHTRTLKTKYKMTSKNWTRRQGRDIPRPINELQSNLKMWNNQLNRIQEIQRRICVLLNNLDDTLEVKGDILKDSLLRAYHIWLTVAAREIYLALNRMVEPSFFSRLICLIKIIYNSNYSCITRACIRQKLLSAHWVTLVKLMVNCGRTGVLGRGVGREEYLS